MITRMRKPVAPRPLLPKFRLVGMEMEGPGKLADLHQFDVIGKPPQKTDESRRHYVRGALLFRALSAIRVIISNIMDAATIAVIWFGLSLVGIRHTTSPPMMFMPLTE